MRNLKRLAKEVRPYWKIMVLIAIFTVVNAALGLQPPKIVQYIVDHLINRERFNFFLVSFAFVLIAVVSGLVGFGQTLAVTYLGQRFKLDMRRKLYGPCKRSASGFSRRVRPAS